MRRLWNISVWVGFLIVLAAFVTYPTILARFPGTWDVPWASLLMFAAGLALIARGLRRANREPQLYRGRIFGAILMGLGVAAAALFGSVFFHLARDLPSSRNAPRVGQKAPDFTLAGQDGSPVSLSNLLDSGTSGADRRNGVVLIFYRGFW